MTVKPDERAAPAARPQPPQQPAHPAPPLPRRDVRDARPADTRSARMEPAIDPALTKRNLASDPGYMDAVKAWNRFRFVRAGWFSAQEAIEYID